MWGLGCLFIISNVNVIAIVAYVLVIVIKGECFLFPTSDGKDDSPAKARERVFTNATHGCVLIKRSVGVVIIAAFVNVVTFAAVVVAAVVGKRALPSFPS